jgi:hypothetical protein
MYIFMYTCARNYLRQRMFWNSKGLEISSGWISGYKQPVPRHSHSDRDFPRKHTKGSVGTDHEIRFHT